MAGKQNFTQVLPWANKCRLPQVSQFFKIPTLLCPNDLNNVLQNFLIGQWTSSLFSFFCIFLQKLKKWLACIRRGHSMPVPQAFIAAIMRLKARAGIIFYNLREI